MDFAPIVPVQYMPADITTYHLILAHQVCQDISYRAYYTLLSSDHTIILDNSVIELGEVNLKYVHEALKHFNASPFQGKLILVAPDSLRSREETVNLHRDFLKDDHIRKALSSPNIDLMVVPQGKDTKEWISCLTDIYGFGYEFIDYIGVPRLTEDFEGGRFNLVMESYDLLHDKRVHLLGIQHYLEEVAWAKGIPNIVGVDSSLPLRAAFSNITAKAVEDLRKLPDPDRYDVKMYNLVRLRIRECQSYVQRKPSIVD